MEEVIKYFENLEARLDALEARVNALEQKQAANTQQLLALHANIESASESISKVQSILEEAQQKNELVIEPTIPETPVQEIPEEPVIEEPAVVEPELIVEPEPVVEAEPVAEPEPIVESEPVKEEVKVEEVASPNATLYGKAVDDIRQAISLGDRFLFQRELFGQNAELMQRTLTELNALGSFDEAAAYISRFGWDQESPTYQQFLVTLHRRFG